MNRKRNIAVITVALLACTAGTPAVARLASNSLESNRLASNRLASNRLASNRLATNRLATNRLATNRLATNSTAPNAVIGEGAIDSVVAIELADGTRIQM
jgi:hypothetical protein